MGQEITVYPVLVSVSPECTYLTCSSSGGDGLVAARHLFYYGYRPTIFYPKRSKNELYQVSYFLHFTQLQPCLSVGYMCTRRGESYFVYIIAVGYLLWVHSYKVIIAEGRLVFDIRNGQGL